MARFWYFFTAANSIYECSAILVRMQCVLCCNGMIRQDGRFVTRRWVSIYSVAYASLMVCGVGTTMYLKVSSPAEQEQLEQLDNLMVMIAGLELFMSTSIYLITVISMQRKASDHVEFYARISKMDERLVRDFGANMHYEKLQRKNISVMFFVTAAYAGAVCVGVSQLDKGDFILMFMGTWCYAFITGSPHYNGYVHINLVEIITIRFRLLQKIIDEKYLQRMFPSAGLRARRLESAIEMVKELYALVDVINTIYMVSLIAAMAHDFSLTTSELYLIFEHIFIANGEIHTLIYVVMIMLPPVYKILMAPVYCSKAMKEGQHCLRIITRSDFWFPGNARVHCLVSSMMYWRLENKIEFTMGFNIPLNKSLIAVTVSVILNYLVILIQFRTTQELGDLINTQKQVVQDFIGEMA